MLRASIAFFCLGLVSILLGASGISGVSIHIGKILFASFLLLTFVSFGISLITGKKAQLI